MLERERVSEKENRAKKRGEILEKSRAVRRSSQSQFRETGAAVCRWASARGGEGDRARARRVATEAFSRAAAQHAALPTFPSGEFRDYIVRVCE